MSGFSIEWLSLREPHDVRARNPIVLDAVSARFRSHPSLGIVDLACGTGATLRALAGRLPAQQRWDLVDNDPLLLATAGSGSSPGRIDLNPIELDLTTGFEGVLNGRIDLVTTSALLDLVSDEWLARLVHCTRANALPVYAALSYDGRITLSPSHPLDAAVVSAVNAHQQTDKGFGPALGPSGAAVAISRFEEIGYSVTSGISDWAIGPGDQNMQAELLDGWAAAASEIRALSRADLDHWLNDRKNALSDGISTMRVGHVDFFASPITKR
ncbi:class I SAM-dependent methyltransferase [Bradyrhizobium manausense]|jgi:hypothetical protein|uniref:class I SAM-dependent methyltransferase n=1 Tax=Bradyrhizobium manausense TaxID=989370 RepID=UPI001BA55B57|nr:class I SAM-dependent methyltransferase [Bradyrhizobium manausense]MBR0787630.1 class I SAM-dependent methyltransferase [Bradyrhizobium manausense]